MKGEYSVHDNVFQFVLPFHAQSLEGIFKIAVIAVELVLPMMYGRHVGVRTETIVHRAKDVAKLQEELKDMGEDEDFEYEYEEDADDDFDYEYEDENWDEEEEKK